MMEQRLKTYFLILVSIVMLIAPVFPHHHHGEVLCMVQDMDDDTVYHIDDEICSDIFSAQHPHRSDCQAGCVTQFQLENLQMNQDLDPGYTFYTLVYDSRIKLTASVSMQHVYEMDAVYIEPLHAVIVNSIKGLRAPPVL